MIKDTVVINQPTGCKVYYRVNEERLKSCNPLLRCIYADTTNTEEAIKLVMEELHVTQEVYLKPVLVLIQGGKV